MKKNHPGLICFLSTSIWVLTTGCSPEALKSLQGLGQKIDQVRSPETAASTLPGQVTPVGKGKGQRIAIKAQAVSNVASLPALPESQWVKMTGKVQLPPIHQRNILGRKMIGSNEHDHLMDSSKSHIHTQKSTFKPRKTNYTVVQPTSVALNRYLKVWAIPLAAPGAKRDEWSRRGSDGQALLLDNEAYEGILDAQGNFEILVPPYEPGYMIAVDGAKVHLKARVPGFAQATKENVVVDLKSTMLADVSLHAPASVQQLSNAELMSHFPQLDQQVALLQNKYLGRLGFNESRRLAKKAVTQANFKTQFTGCTGGSPEPTCYDNTTDIVYNLMAATDISDFASTSYNVAFASAPGAILQNQYRNGSTGVAFTGLLRPRMLFPRTRVVEDTTGGFALVTPPDAKGGHVRMIFESSAVHSVGLTIQNGTSHSTTGSTTQRRGFRFIVRDRGGNVIHTYNWYTNQDSTGPGFYGLTSPDAIGSLEIKVTGADPFTIGNLIYADDYLPDTITADPAGNALRANLGWRATGGFQKSTTGATSTTFTHPYFSGSVGMRSGGANYSEGPYWQSPYGYSSSTLVAPAFTLSNLPMLQSKDQSTSKWYVGPTIDASKGYTDTLISKLRIPNNNEATGTGATTTMSAAAAAASTTTSIVLPPGEGVNFRPNGPIQISGGAFATPITRLVQTVAGDNLTLFEALPAAMTGAESIYSYPTYAQSYADTDFHYHESTAAMHTHWSHVHWQAYIGVEDSAQYENVSGTTERYVEYSTDNGKTWRNAYWFKDLNHHGSNGQWWNNHMHPFPDSDLNETDLNGDGSVSTDFDKDGTAEYTATIDNNHDSTIDSSDNQREWDTEFYMEYTALDPAATGDVHPYNAAVQVVTGDIEGTSIVYRFRFVGPTAPASCTTGGAAISCDGWKIDDVAFNNDDPDVGYYTDFEGAYDSNLD